MFNAWRKMSVMELHTNAHSRNAKTISSAVSANNPSTNAVLKSGIPARGQLRITADNCEQLRIDQMHLRKREAMAALVQDIAFFVAKSICRSIQLPQEIFQCCHAGHSVKDGMLRYHQIQNPSQNIKQ
jgi:hypothetical protein